jgi:5-bromo-4-chloroindolyl phosphate hydrolysis protein
MLFIDYPPKRYRKLIYKCIVIMALICIINSTLLLYSNSKFFLWFTFIFPVFNFIVFFVIFLHSLIVELMKKSKNEDTCYIIEKYPSIWNRLRPFGKFTKNDFAYFYFIRGNYDNGNDKRLERIKKNERDKIACFIWICLTTIGPWGLNILAIYIKKKYM